MNFRPAIFPVLAAVGLAVSVHAAPPPAPAPEKPEAPKSVFNIPENPAQGRDPFYPASMHPYLSHAVPKSAAAPSLTDLVVKSILSSGGKVFAIINNHAFAPGEDGTVTVRDGQRMSVRCVAINADAGTVTVESEGVRAVLRFGNQ